jgi:hypothetical protein
MPPRFSTPSAWDGGDGGGGGPPVGGRKVLTEADILSRSKVTNAKMDGGLSEQPAPKLFTPDVYDDFQNALLLLERRVGGGRGSLSREDVSRLEEGTARIVREMNEFLADPKGCGDRIAGAYAGAGVAAVVDAGGAAVKAAPPAHAAAAAAPPRTTVAPPPPRPGEPGGGRYRRALGGDGAAPTSPAAAAVRSPPPPPPPRPSPDAAVGDPAAAAKYGDEEDAGNVGFGLARGTTNTYVIPGMEEMSPEEYRERLQETISARQVSTAPVAAKGGGAQ